MKKVLNKKLRVIKNMPPLYHTLPNRNFDIKKSEVVRWLIEQPEVLNYLWDHIKQSGVLEYDIETKKWKGVDYAD